MKERVDPYLDQFACEKDRRNMMISNEQYTKRSAKNINMIKKAMDNKGIIVADIQKDGTDIDMKKFEALYEAAEIVADTVIQVGKTLYDVLSSDPVQMIIGNVFESMNEEVEC